MNTRQVFKKMQLNSKIMKVYRRLKNWDITQSLEENSERAGISLNRGRGFAIFYELPILSKKKMEREKFRSEIITLYTQEGYKINEIADHLNLTSYFVKNTISIHEITQKKSGLLDMIKDQKLTIEQIAKAYGISKKQINQLLAKN